jgi:FlaA1/EpsC-like NDP-sugar epimerase
MAERGEVFVLDMGEPIRIADLASNMIALSGMSVRDENNPQGDIEITYVGLRPGEKLYEELFVGSDSKATAHPRIMMANERFLPAETLQVHLDNLVAAIKAGSGSAVRDGLRKLIKPDQGEFADNVTVLRRA